MPRFDAVGIIATNMVETLAFYRLLGLDIPEAADYESHVEVTILDGFRLMFDTIEVIERFSTYTPSLEDQGVGFALRCDSSSEVDSLYAKITAAGHHGREEPFDALWGQRYATVLDPNGNPVHLYAPLDQASTDG